MSKEELDQRSVDKGEPYWNGNDNTQSSNSEEDDDELDPLEYVCPTPLPSRKD